MSETKFCEFCHICLTCDLGVNPVKYDELTLCQKCYKKIEGA